MRKNFFQLPLQRQIQIGVMTVSCCVGLIIMVIILTSTILLVNLTYMDFTNYINLKENQQIDQIALNFDIKSNAITETTYYSMQWVRNFVMNNYNSQDFLNNLNISDVSDNIKSIDQPIDYSDCDLNIYSNNCIFYKIYDNATNTAQSAEFLNYLKILDIALPIIQNTFSYRFQDNAIDPIFNVLVIYSNYFKTVFFYNPIKGITVQDFYNTNYTLDDFNYYMNYSSFYLNQAANYFTDQISHDYLNLNDFLMKNPYQTYMLIDNKLKIPYFTNETSKTIVATQSFSYKNLSSMDQIADSNNVIDLIEGDWSTLIIDNLSSEWAQSYQGVKLIITGTNQDILTQTDCQYFLKFYELQNNYSNYTNGQDPYNTSVISDCIYYPESKVKFENLFDLGNINSNYSMIKRKINIPLFNDRIDRNSFSDTRYKILKYSSPDYQAKVFINTFFTFGAPSNIYIFKNTKLLENSISRLWGFFVRIIIFILFYNIITWYIFIILILFIVWKVTKEITTPIDRLIEEVTKLGGGEIDQGDDAKGDDKGEVITIRKSIAEEITYPDDGDINEMFKICENLIKGGFTEHGTNHTRRGNDANLILSYNNIAFVKTNDLIILEDFIEFHAHNKKSIFSSEKEKSNKKFDSKDFNTDVSENLITNNENITQLNMTSMNESSYNKNEKKNVSNKFYQSKFTDKKFVKSKKESNYNTSKTHLNLLNQYSNTIQLNSDKFLDEYVTDLVSEYDSKNKENEKKEKKKEDSSNKRLESNSTGNDDKENFEDILSNKKGYLNSLFLSKTNKGKGLFLDIY